jgi:hypothetical protein
VYDGAVDREDPEHERRLADEASYVCGPCGEVIVVPLDPSAGHRQAYVEDCPVCCAPNEITVEFDEDGTAQVSSRPE